MSHPKEDVFQPYPPRDAAANQLIEYAKLHKIRNSVITTNSSNPVSDIDASLKVGPRGPILLQDNVFIDHISHFDRERVPERVVHAKGPGAFGYFELTADIKKYTAMKVFSEVGKKTPVAVRFSQLYGESGYPDTVRDIRGFAIKFYTEDGIWDIVGNNMPMSFIRDVNLFPSFIHVMKRNPETHLRDMDMFWDLFSLRPESIHLLMVLYSDRGIPYSYRNMHGYGIHTFEFVNDQGKISYCKFHFLSDQGIKNMSPQDAVRAAGEDPDYLLRDLYNNIADGKKPSWTLNLQIMTVEQAKNYRFNPFDSTKIWEHDDFPLIPIGKLVLNRNPLNYFAEIEQISFSPANMIPGIRPSPDNILQGRLFAYGDAARHRVGVNVNELPINSPDSIKRTNFSRDGYGAIDNQGNAPNYHPNSFGGPEASPRAKRLEVNMSLHGDVKRYDTEDEDNFTQPRFLYQKVFSSAEKKRIAENLGQSLSSVTEFIQKRAIANFAKIDENLAKDIRANLNKNIKRKEYHYLEDDRNIK